MNEKGIISSFSDQDPATLPGVESGLGGSDTKFVHAELLERKNTKISKNNP